MFNPAAVTEQSDGPHNKFEKALQSSLRRKSAKMLRSCSYCTSYCFKQYGKIAKFRLATSAVTPMLPGIMKEFKCEENVVRTAMTIRLKYQRLATGETPIGTGIHWPVHGLIPRGRSSCSDRLFVLTFVLAFVLTGFVRGKCAGDDELRYD